MQLKILAATGFAFHALLGNLCMMPMALAQGMPMPHEERMEMAMSPVLPMSPARCDHCMKVQSSDGDRSQPSGCAGHCFAQARDTAANTTTFYAPRVAAAAPMPTTVASAPLTRAAVAPPAMAPPANILTDTIVLRL